MASPLLQRKAENSRSRRKVWDLESVSVGI